MRHSTLTGAWALGNVVIVTDALDELRLRLRDAVSRLRSGELGPEQTLAMIEECSRLATDVSAEVDAGVRAALEPLPNLPGQLPLPAQ